MTKVLDDYPEMMTITELSEYLRVHANTAYSYIKKSKIPHVKIGHQIRIYREDVRAFVSNSQICQSGNNNVSCSL